MLPGVVASLRKNDDVILVRVLLTIVLVQFVPYFFMGFAIFGFLRYIFSKMGLDNSNALGKEFYSRQKYLVQQDQPALELAHNV